MTGWEDDSEEEETDAFGVPTGESDGVESGGTTISISAEDDGEDWFDIGHEPIYKTKTAQNIAFSAIENFCLLKIREKARI